MLYDFYMRPLFLPVIALILLTVAVVKVPELFKEGFTCANSISCIKDLSGKYEDTKIGISMGRRIDVPQALARGIEESHVLGESYNANKHISVDLTHQTLQAFEEDKLIYQFPVSTGKWAKTPTGDFKIWIKLRYTRMTGGQGADFYDLPNVPYVMFFYNNNHPQSQGFGLHGAYWHNNFGHPMSHGCVNMREEDVAKLYSWANPPTQGNLTYASSDSPGTPIKIYGETPVE